MNKRVKQFLLTFGIGIIVYVIRSLIFTGFSYASTQAFLIDFGIHQMYAFVLGYSNMYYFDYLERRKWRPGQRLIRIIVGILGSMLVTLCGLVFVRAFVEVFIDGHTLEYFIANEKWGYYSFGMGVTLSIVVVFHIVYFYNRYQQRKIKEQKVIAGTASAKFDALKNQLDPHFLFNSLNVLSSLIDENPASAQKFTTGLSKVYRYVLEQKNKELITVDEELKFARTYMSLLKMRFEDSIIFEIPDRAANPESKVVPLSLQLLLENAVKHNMVTSSKPLHIKIYETRDSLVVENNLQPKQIVKKSSGVGLSNIKQRYGLLTKKNIIINQEANRFAVAIPMLTKQITIMRSTVPTQNQMDDRYVRARKHVDELKEFYYSLVSYCVIMPFLFFIWYKFTPFTIQWFWFPMFGWGIGLAVQAYKVFVNDSAFGRNWEERKIREYMKEEEQNRWK